MNKIIVAISILLMQCGCNPAKQMARHQKQYQQLVDEYIKDHPQRIDTATIFLPGAADSSNYYKAKADSLKLIKQQNIVHVQTKYKDTCTTSIDNYNEGFKLGYQVGFSDGKISTAPVHDTLVRTITPTDEITKLNSTIKKLQDEQLVQAKKFNWLWPFIISCIVITLLTALLIKKF